MFYIISIVQDFALAGPAEPEARLQNLSLAVTQETPREKWTAQQ